MHRNRGRCRSHGEGSNRRSDWGCATGWSGRLVRWQRQRAPHRYNAAWMGRVFSSTTASGFRFGGLFSAVAGPRSGVTNVYNSNYGVRGDGAPLPVLLPPKPPEPRIKNVDWFSKMTLPEFLSFVCTTAVTAAALPLSRTSMRLFHGSLVMFLDRM